jgi:hypothetical protein
MDPYSQANELKRYLRLEHNITPDFIESHGHNSFSLIYLMTGSEKLNSDNSVWSIRETIKEQCGAFLRVTRCGEKRPYAIRCNIVLTHPDVVFEYEG